MASGLSVSHVHDGGLVRANAAAPRKGNRYVCMQCTLFRGSLHTYAYVHAPRSLRLKR